MFFQPTVRDTPPRFRRTRRPSVIRIILLVAVAGIAAMILFSCSTMRIASWRAVPALQSVIGDHGSVSASVREFNYSSGSNCALSVDLVDDITVDETTAVLRSLAPSERFAPCDISQVEMSTRSEVHADDWDTISDDGWATVADYLARPGPISLYLATEGESKLTVAEPATYAEFVDIVRGFTTGHRLEDAIGPVDWSMAWKSDAGTYESVRIITDETPPPGLADFLAALAVPLQGSSGLDSIVYTIVDGNARLNANLRTPDDAVEAAIEAAFTASGLHGELSINLPAE